MITYSSDKIYPYVYILTHKETGQFYIGSRYTKYQKYPSHIDIQKYQSSSKKVKELGFENFNVQIISEFFNENTKYDDAWQFEHQLINENFSNPLILNGHRFENTNIKFMFKHQSEKGKQNLREFWTGKPKSEAQKLKQSKNLKGRKMTPEQCLKISQAQLGKKRGPYKKKQNVKLHDHSLPMLE